MKNPIAKILIAISAISILASILIVFYPSVKASVLSNLSDRKIKILIVPGHEPKAGGTDYNGIFERDLTVKLSDILADYLSRNSKFEIVVARDINDWNPIIKDYVETNKDSIMDWVYSKKAEMQKKVDNGEMTLINPDMKHNTAEDSTVLYLYGINSWSNKNKENIVIHVHFNNNPKYKGKPNYNGFAIYVPEKQYDNSSSSKALANYVYNELVKIENPSIMPQEKGTIIEDQELMAIGRYNTLDAISNVIEYSYMYETKMLSSSTRNAYIDKAASSTAIAIEKYILTELK